MKSKSGLLALPEKDTYRKASMLAKDKRPAEKSLKELAKKR
jgi:hypothetical protein